jgi:acyl-CoA synthetase (AMP-forming)/AMP-acid ligase II
MTSSPSLPDVDLLASDDPVGAFLDAHLAGARVLLRTSGTTGPPRTVVRSTSSWTTSFGHVSRLASITRSSRLWVPGPPTGTMNLFAQVHAAAVGARCVDSPDEATHWVVTPSVLRSSLPSARPGVVVVVAGDRLDASLRAAGVSAGLVVHHYYGAAELSFVAWGADASSLRPFPGVAVEPRDGVLWVRSPYVSDGYVEGSGAFVLDASGWATVGDRGRLLSDGTLLVDGRDDVVITGGATVHIADVEGSLLPAASGPAVVVGVPHAELGAVVALVVEREEDAEVLRTLSRSALSPALRPRLFFRLAPLPLAPSGKVDRAAVADAVASGVAEVLVP